MAMENTLIYNSLVHNSGEQEEVKRISNDSKIAVGYGVIAICNFVIINKLINQLFIVFKNSCFAAFYIFYFSLNINETVSFCYVVY